MYYRMAWLPLLFLCFEIFGQCANCEDQLNISTGPDCIATLTIQQVTEGTLCPGDYLIVIETVFGIPIESGTNLVQLETDDLIGETVRIRVIHISSGEMCSFLSPIEDKLPPILTCPNDTLACTASLAVADVDSISVSDNCDDLMTLIFTNGPITPNCAEPDFIATLERQWIATDSSGNADTCIQTIFLEKPDISLVEFPANIPVDCGAPNLDPEIAGEPTINGEPIDNDGYCEMHVSYTDQIVSATGNCEVRLFRYWLVIDDCTGAEARDTQIIKTIDTELPTILCQPGMTAPTDPDTCIATVQLPPPMSVSDNCGSLVITIINTDGVEQPLNQPIYLPPGVHNITYIVRDECGNEATCEMPVTVIDNQTPTGICDEFTSVSLTTTGLAIVPAFNFDDGSYDNCGPVHFLASRDGEPFMSTVVFDCEDVGIPVMVTVRVSEILNGNSYSDCMVEVDVEDKLPPIFLSCPGNTTVDCGTDLSNLDDFGTPELFDNCGYNLTETDDSDLGICGTGSITRTFTITDDSSNSSTCEQVISVENQSPFDGNTIVWPLDYMAPNVCLPTGEFDPEDLPIENGFPTYPNDGCSMIAESYDNQLFDIDFPACYKIVRDWTLIDWCSYDPANPGAGGVWSHQQLIKITDTESPTVTACLDQITVGIDSVCGAGFVTLNDVALDLDCNGEVTIVNNSAYANSNGANASGYYPEGTHTVLFQIEDGCGNKANCSTVITVEDDKKPTPYCNTGIIGEIQTMGGDTMAVIHVDMLNFNSFDNCTAQEDLVFSIQLDTVSPASPTDDTELVFDCNGVGSHLVKVWVTDEAGNSDYCVTSVIIQDNMLICPDNDDPLMASISGDIQTEMGESIEEVMVEISGSNVFPDPTGLDGSFAIPNLPLGFNYTVIPEKDINPENGVTTWDMVLMTKHVLGVKYLDSPYKIIAADVNNSGTVTTMDVVELRKLILDINETFPQNKSWRFVDKHHSFQDPMNPFFPPYPEVMNVNNFTQDELEANFTGVKIGDLNDSAEPNSLVGSDDRSYLDDLILMSDNQYVRVGENLKIDFRLKDIQTLFGWQFTLNFDKDALEFLEFEKGEIEDLEEENFGWSHLNEGVITMSWFDLNPRKISETERLFSLKFKSKTNAELRDLFNINSRYTLAEAYDENEELMNVKLEFGNEISKESDVEFQLYQNQPNPFTESTSIGFNLPESSQGTVTVFDVSGKVLRTFEGQFSKGYNELRINKKDLNMSGVLWYQLETPKYNATRKMIVLE